MYEQYHACRSCLNKRVAIHTVRGERHEGVIVNVDEQNVFLDTSSGEANDRARTLSKKKKAKTTAFGFGGFDGFGFNDAILTLALFDLLAIALI